MLPMCVDEVEINLQRVGVEGTHLISNSNICGSRSLALKTPKNWMVIGWMVQLKMTTMWFHSCPIFGPMDHNRLVLCTAWRPRDHDCGNARSSDFHLRKTLRSYAHTQSLGLVLLWHFCVKSWIKDTSLGADPPADAI